MNHRKILKKDEAKSRLLKIISPNGYRLVEPFEYKGSRNTTVKLYCPKHKLTWEVTWHRISFRYNKKSDKYTGCKKCRIIYTKEECQKVAKTFKYRSVFSSKCEGYYLAALRNGWLDEICKHMTVRGNRYLRCIYSYEFRNINSKDYVYVGLTDSIEHRDKGHLIKGSVFNFCKKNKIKKRNIKQLTDYVEKDEAVKLEGQILDRYLSEGWVPINKVKTGGLGGNLTLGGLTFKECSSRASLFKNRSEWKQKDYSSYYIASKHGWIDKIKIQKKNYGNSSSTFWTKEKCINEGLKYSTLKVFRKHCGVVYAIAAKRGWLEDVTGHMAKRVQNHNYTTDSVLKLLKEFNSITSFYKAYPSIKNWCSKNHIRLKDYTDKGFDYRSPKKKVQQFDKSGTLIREYECARDAVVYGFDYKKISAVCNGKNKTHKGFIFRFVK